MVLDALQRGEEARKRRRGRAGEAGAGQADGGGHKRPCGGGRGPVEWGITPGEAGGRMALDQIGESGLMAVSDARLWGVA